MHERLSFLNLICLLSRTEDRNRVLTLASALAHKSFLVMEFGCLEEKRLG